MTMKVLLEVQLKDDALDTYYAGIHATLQQTRARVGLVRAEVLIDDSDPTSVVVVETWESAADHDAYLAWRATPEGAPTQLATAVAAPPITRTFIERNDL